MLKRLIPLLVAALLPIAACSQGITYNQVITWSGSATTSAAGPSDTIRDVNQTGAWLSVCVSGSSVGATAELEASYNKTTWFQISNVATIGIPNAGPSYPCESIEASGYYPFTRLNILSTQGTSPSISANYSASFTPVAPQGIQRAGIQPAPVTAIPTSGSYISGALSSTPQSLDVNAPAIAVTSLSVTNPNTGVVYVLFSGNSNAPTSDKGYFFAIPASTSVTITPAVPVEAVSAATSAPYTSTVACSTSPTSLVAPASACIVSVAFQAIPAVNVNINAAGTVINRQLDTTPWGN